MSILIRPDGDNIAQYLCNLYNLSYLPTTTTSFKPGERYDALCSDGLNYVVGVKEYDSKKEFGTLHFNYWNRANDYHGPFQCLYLAKEVSDTNMSLIISY